MDLCKYLGRLSSILRNNKRRFCVCTMVCYTLFYDIYQLFDVAIYSRIIPIYSFVCLLFAYCLLTSDAEVLKLLMFWFRITKLQTSKITNFQQHVT